MTAVPRPLSPGVVVEPDIYNPDRYISVECQLGVHRACPGGLKNDPGQDPWICHCGLEMCPCRQRLT